MANHYCLRSNRFVIPLGRSAIVIGRSQECEIVVDSAGVSRRHARLMPMPSGLLLEDLGSVNGVFIDGIRLMGARLLAIGDQFTIDGQMFALEEGTAPEERRARTADATARFDTAPAEPKKSVPPPAAVPEDATERREATDLIGAVADALFAARRFEQAEAALAPLLASALASAKSGTLQPAAQDAAFGSAVKLARAVGKATWIEFAFELGTHSPRLLRAELVDELYDLVRKVPGVRRRLLRTYLDALAGARAARSPNEIFVQRRIEGLVALLDSG